MNENLIYMVAIPDESTKVNNSDYAQYSIKSWERYTADNKIDFLLVSQNQDFRFNKPIWNKELIYQFGKKYDKIGIVDSDTIIHPDAPNIFELFNEDQFCGVNDICDLSWLFKSIDDRQKFFPGVQMDIFKYINAGVLFFGKKYLEIFEKLLNFYLTNKEEIEKIDGGGKEQTLLNFMLQSEHDFKDKKCDKCHSGYFTETSMNDDLSGVLHCSNCNHEINRHQIVPITLLDPCWNLLSIHRKNMFTNNWQMYPKYGGMVVKGDEFSYPHFVKYAYIWHFTGFPIEDRTRMMSVTWDLIK